MKIYAISDIHGRLPFEPVPKCDLLIVAGDICPDYRPIDLQGKWLQDRFIPWLKEQPATKIVGVWGNHDLIGTKGHHYFTDALNGHIEMLADQATVVNGLFIYGTPWTPNLPRWAFSVDGDIPTGLLARIPEGLDILISHGPPYGYHDEAPIPNPDGDYHVGSKSLEFVLRRVQPRVTVCGHIHEGRGHTHAPFGHVYNVASLDGFYRPYEKRFTEIEVE